MVEPSGCGFAKSSPRRWCFPPFRPVSGHSNAKFHTFAVHGNQIIARTK